MTPEAEQLRMVEEPALAAIIPAEELLVPAIDSVALVICTFSTVALSMLSALLPLLPSQTASMPHWPVLDTDAPSIRRLRTLPLMRPKMLA